MMTCRRPIPARLWPGDGKSNILEGVLVQSLGMDIEIFFMQCLLIGELCALAGLASVLINMQKPVLVQCV